MSSTPTGRVPAKILSDDIKCYHALVTIEGYDPHDPDLKLDVITASYEELLADQAAMVRCQVALDLMRYKLANSEQRIHRQIQSVKGAVCGQFGSDSNQYASLGMKKKSERRRGGGKARPAAGA